jgi:predicted 3-demethylubiquinone-9 3-methyltransferase (glyoxalase superfamily)
LKKWESKKKQNGIQKNQQRKVRSIPICTLLANAKFSGLFKLLFNYLSNNNEKNNTPNLWFDHNAKEAVDFYLEVFPDSKIISTTYYPNKGLADFQKEFAGKVLTIEFDLSGNRFVAINAGPEFKFNESISFVVPCKDQKEIDYYWEHLSSVKESEQCGWCKDKYGLSAGKLCLKKWESS